MKEFQTILKKYDRDYLSRLLEQTPRADTLALEYFKDVAACLDTMTRLKHVDRNPTGFGLNDAAILGLLVRCWKLLELVIWIYEYDSAEFEIIAERSLIEVSVTATYLLNADESVIEDYRKCSYKNRLKILEQINSDVAFFESKSGKRLVKSIREKLALEGLDEHSFAQQEKNKWKMQGKSFFDIFNEVLGKDMYAVAYGASSQSVHASWHDIRSYSLKQSKKGRFVPQYEKIRANVGNISLVVPFVTMPFPYWIERVGLNDEPNLSKLLTSFNHINYRLFDYYSRRLYGI